MSKYPQLDNAVLSLKKSGLSDEQIKKDLKTAGWNDFDIGESYKTFNQTLNNSIPLKKEENLSNNIPSNNNFSVNELNARPKHTGIKIAIFIFVLLLIAGGVSAYFVFNPFSIPPYKEGNLVSGVLSKVSEIKSSKNTVSVNLYFTDRDAGARSFESIRPDQTELKEKYKRDISRAKYVDNIRRMLDDYKRVNAKYPGSLQELETFFKSKQFTYYYYSSSEDSLKDPFTKKYFGFRTKNNGQDYEISVEFETTEAIDILSYTLDLYKDSTYSSYNYIIKDNNVVFSFGNYYLYFDPELPKSTYETIVEMIEYLPTEANVSAAFISEIEREEGDKIPSFYFGLNGEGDLGDITYKFDVEAKKANDEYYFRLNNFPSFFLSFFSYIKKGEWIQIDDFNENSPFSLNPKALEENYNNADSKIKKATEIFVKTADEEKLFSFKSKPIKEKVDNQFLYKYELDIKQDTFKAFSEKIIQELKSDPETEDMINFSVETFSKFLESEGYPEIFDFYRENLSFTLWVDKKGFPIIFEMKARIIPSDENKLLKDKQVVLETKFVFENINQDINIEVPEDYKKLSEIYEDSGLKDMEDKGTDASVKAYLNGMRASAEISYDEKGNYNNVCEKSVETIKNIERVYGENGIVLCRDGSDDGANETWAAISSLKSETGFYCVDSAGNSKVTDSSNIGSGQQAAKCN